MKKVKDILKKVLIIYIISYIILTSMTSSLARGYDKQCGEYAGKWAIDFINKYSVKSSYTTSALGSINGKSACRWSSGADSRGFGSGTFYGCCTCWVHWIFYYALGVDINDLGFDPLSDTAYSNLKGGNQYFDDITGQTLQAGDILIVCGHAEMYAGDNQHANFGSTPMNVHSACSRMTPGQSGEGAIAVRLKSSVQVNPAGSVPVDELEDEDLSIYDDNGFIYKGVATLESYESSTSLGKWIIKMLSEILDYLIGILTLIVRVVVVGWTAIVERVFIDGIVNSVTGITNKRDENWTTDPSLKDEIDEDAEADERKEEEQKEELRDIGDQDNPNEYVSTGMQQISKTGGNVQLKTSSKANVTVENIVYNKVPILDINFFNFESAGGAVVDEDGIIYIIKENVAMWYYIFRIIAILIMLIALIYLGIRMALTTVAEKKAVYKEMLLSWVAGFILVFAISFIMYAIISLNESFISWLIPEYEDGSELSLYETVRTKAYSLKATTGFTGMFMYIILVYYSIRYLILYFKRFLTVTILALMSPFVAVSYAIEKINKNGKGGEIYGNWFKDFLYSVIIQSIHALIYTLFISTILKLTETSMVGILVGFLFLHLMVKVDPIMREIFGLNKGSAGKLSFGKTSEMRAMIKEGKEYAGGAKQLAKRYGNHLGNTVVKPISKVTGRVAGATGDAIDGLRNYLGIENKESNQDVSINPEEQKKRKEKKEERRKQRQQMFEEAVTGARVGLNMAKTAGLAAITLPMLIAEPVIGMDILDATISSSARTKALIGKYGEKLKRTKPKTAKPGQRFKLKGIQPKNKKSANNIINRLKALGVGFTLKPGVDASRINENDVLSNRAGFSGNPNSQNDPNIQNNQNTQQNGTRRKRINLKDVRIEDLTEEQRKELATKLGVNNLTLVSKYKTVEEVLNETGDITKTEKYAELLGQAQALEREIEAEYKSITGKLDNQIAEAERTVNAEFAAKLQAKKAKELKNTAVFMSKPLSEKDIFRAMQNYKSKVPQFSAVGELSQADMEGITKEINTILQQRGEGVAMTKEFTQKVEKELTANRRKADEERTRRVNNDRAGEDISAKGKAQSAVAEDVHEMNQDGKKVRKSLKDKVKEQNAPDLYNPNSENNRNAPKQNAGGSKETEEGATERLVKNIVNASRGASAKTSTNATPRHIDFAKKLDELQKLTEQMSEISDEESEFNLDDIFRRLEAL